MQDALRSRHSVRSRAAFTCSLINGDPDATAVAVTGELDIATASQLAHTLRDAQARSRLVVLDLCELAFIDSAGIHAIDDAAAHARDTGRRLVVLPAPAGVERLFALTGTLEALERGDVAAVESAALPAHQARSRRSSRDSSSEGFRGSHAPAVSNPVPRR